MNYLIRRSGKEMEVITGKAHRRDALKKTYWRIQANAYCRYIHTYIHTKINACTYTHAAQEEEKEEERRTTTKTMKQLKKNKNNLPLSPTVISQSAGTRLSSTAPVPGNGKGITACLRQSSSGAFLCSAPSPRPERCSGMMTSLSV